MNKILPALPVLAFLAACSGNGGSQNGNAGSGTQITGAGLNGAQRDSMTDARELTPNQMYLLDITLHLTSWIFPKGHRIRLAVSNALWPMTWPTPFPMTTSLGVGGEDGSHLSLPTVPLHGPAATQLSPPQASEERSDMHAAGFPWPGEWKVERDEAHQKAKVIWKGKAETTYPWGKETDLEQLTYELNDANPAVNTIHGEAESIYRLSGRVLSWRGHLSVSSNEKNFFYEYTRELLKDGQLLKQKTWKEIIPRDHQ